MNYKQIYAIKKSNEAKILKICPELKNAPGIYIFYRNDESGMKFCYVGQATKSVLQRVAEHLSGYQHIDLSVKKRGFYSEDNPHGWNVKAICYCKQEECDMLEQKYIMEYSQSGHQMLNKKLGGQCAGNDKIDEYRPAKGYRDGLNQGYRNASKEIANLFEKHLDFVPKCNPPNKNQQKAVEKFKVFLGCCKGEQEDG